jgi:hypothetical protein
LFKQKFTGGSWRRKEESGDLNVGEKSTLELILNVEYGDAN